MRSAERWGLLVAVVLLVNVVLAFPRHDSTANAVTGFLQSDAAWQAYYANPSDQSTWGPYCAGAGGQVRMDVLGVPACGPTGSTDIELAGSTAQFQLFTQGFQCVELVFRYLKVIKGYTPSSSTVVDGADVVDAYASTFGIPKVSNGTVGKAPQPGDVLSFSTNNFSGDSGHAAVVTASSVDAFGNGSVTFANENLSGDAGPLTTTITNWAVSSPFSNQDGVLMYVKWLSFGPTPTPSPTPTVTETSTPSPSPSPTPSVTVTPTPTPHPTASTPPRPKLVQTSSRGVVTLTVTTFAKYSGKSAICFQRSGMTGAVRPLGSTPIKGNGVATRVLHMRSGQLLAMYCKILVDDVPNQYRYTNDITFKVK